MTRRSAAFASFFANGLFAQFAQILLLRELLVVLDGDEFALGAMLAAWLLWIGVGATLAPRGVASASSARLYAAVLTIAVVSLPPALAFVRLSRPLFDAPLGTPLPLASTLLLAAAAAAIPCFCIGMLFPLLVRQTGESPGVVYGAEAIGALVAGALFAFVLVTRAAPLAAAAGAGFVAVGAGAWLLAPRRPPAVWLAIVAAALLAVVPIAQGFDGRLERTRWRRLLPSFELLESSESPYGRYALLHAAGQYSLLLNGKPLADLPDAQAGVQLVHTSLLQLADVDDVLILAHVPEPLIRESLRHQPRRIDAVHLDRLPLEILRRRLPPAALPRFDPASVRRHHTDPAAYLRQTDRSYNAILIEAPDPVTLGDNRVYTREFIRSAADHLRPGGILALTLSSQQNYLGPELLARNALVYQTLRHILPETIATPGDICLLLARKAAADDNRAMSLDADGLQRRALERGVSIPVLAAFLSSDPFPRERVIAVNRELAAWPDAVPPVNPLDLPDDEDAGLAPPALNSAPTENTDRNPRAYWATRLVKIAKFEPAALPLVRSLPTIAHAVLGALLLVGLIIVGFTRWSRPARSPARPKRVLLALTIGAVGFGGMTLQMLLLLWFQSRAGQVYVGLALLTAAFMAGLAGGALAAAPSRQPLRTLRRSLGGILFAALIVWPGLQFLDSAAYAAAIVLTAALGGLLGIAFAAAVALWPTEQDTPANAARCLYAADVLGAAPAALLIAAVIVPVDGYLLTAAIAAAAALFALIASHPLTRSTRCAPESHP